MCPLSLEGQDLGKYRILESLGRGGMAQVYKAYHPSLDRYVAVKVLRPDLVEETEFLSRFQREARAIAALRHPNIVQVYDFDVHNDIYYMVMELLEGNTLKVFLNAYRRQAERIPVSDATRIMLDILAGLSYAHKQGVIHRDIKPANIILTKSGQAVLTDFGIAQMLGGTQYTKSGALMGTLNYMAPEQGRDGKCDIRSDIYSLGIVFYEMLTGGVPFDADTPLAIIMKHINDPLPSPRSLEPSVPEALEMILLKTLAKNPDERHQNTLEVTNEINDAAREMDLIVPLSITHLQMLSIPQVKSGAVQIFSGTEKTNLSDNEFDQGDTNVIYDAVGKVDNSLKHGSRGVLSWITILVLGNMLLLWASGVYGWDILGQSWPMELVLTGVLFFILMLENSYIWLIIPGGILVGNGLVLSYYTLSGSWEDWAIFWPLEPLIMAASIVAPFWLSKQPVRGGSFMRWIGKGILVMSGITFIVTLAIAIMNTF